MARFGKKVFIKTLYEQKEYSIMQLMQQRLDKQ